MKNDDMQLCKYKIDINPDLQLVRITKYNEGKSEPIFEWDLPVEAAAMLSMDLMNAVYNLNDIIINKQIRSN